MMRRRAPLALLLLIVAGAAWLFYTRAHWISRTGPAAPLYSSIRYDPAGSAALYDLLELRGIDVRRLYRRHLMRYDRGTLVQIVPLIADPRHDEGPPLDTDELIKWIADGNTVVQFTRDHTALMRQLHVPAGRPATDARDVEEYERSGKDPGAIPGEMVRAPMAGARTAELRLLAPRTFDGKGGAAWRVLARDDDGQPVAGEMRFGRGRLIVVGAPTPVLNGWIEHGENLEAVLDVVGSRGPVLLEEWSHGVRSEQTVIGLIRDAGLTPMLLQLLLLLGVYHWSTQGYRRIDAPTTPRARSCTEQIQTLAYLYGRTMRPAEIHRRVEHEVHTRLATLLRCRPAQLSAKIAPLRGDVAERVREIIRSLEAAAAAVRAGKSADADWAAALTRSHQLLQESHLER